MPRNHDQRQFGLIAVLANWAREGESRGHTTRTTDVAGGGEAAAAVLPMAVWARVFPAAAHTMLTLPAQCFGRLCRCGCEDDEFLRICSRRCSSPNSSLPLARREWFIWPARRRQQERKKLCCWPLCVLFLCPLPLLSGLSSAPTTTEAHLSLSLCVLTIGLLLAIVVVVVAAVVVDAVVGAADCAGAAAAVVVVGSGSGRNKNCAHRTQRVPCWLTVCLPACSLSLSRSLCVCCCLCELCCCCCCQWECAVCAGRARGPDASLPAAGCW